MKKKILLIGIGGHSRSCIDVIDNTNLYKISGYVEKNKFLKIEKTNLKLLGYDKDLVKIFKKIKYAHISIGQMKDLELRKNLFSKLINIGFEIPKIISKKSIVSKKNVKISLFIWILWVARGCFFLEWSCKYEYMAPAQNF